MTSPFLSFVIPAHNIEPRLDCFQTCLASVRAQSFRDIEIIVVDDGSTDQTGRYLKKAQAEDERIRLVRYSTNRGAGYARNMGVEAARGDYVWYVDSDDYVRPCAVAQIRQAAEHVPGADTFCLRGWYLRENAFASTILLCPCSQKEGAKGMHGPRRRLRVWDRDTFLNHFLTGSLQHNPWSHVSSARLARRVRFERLSAAQDVAHALGIYASARTIVTGLSDLYVYRTHRESVSFLLGSRSHRSTTCIVHARVCDAVDRAIERYQLLRTHGLACRVFRMKWRRQLVIRLLAAYPTCDHMVHWFHPIRAAGLGWFKVFYYYWSDIYRNSRQNRRLGRSLRAVLVMALSRYSIRLALCFAGRAKRGRLTGSYHRL